MENAFRTPAQVERRIPHHPGRGGGLITPWLTFSVTALISVNFWAFYLLIQRGLDVPIWVEPFMWLVSILAFLTLLVLTPLHAVATLADVLTKRLSRACLAFVSTSIGVCTMVLMAQILNTFDTSNSFADYSELSSPPPQSEVVWPSDLEVPSLWSDEGCNEPSFVGFLRDAS